MTRCVALALLVIGWSGVSAVQAPAAELEVMVEIPRLNVSEYHRPYIAIWIQEGNRKVVSNLAVWYQMKTPQDDVGTKWLPDLRQWWRRSGRGLKLPIDGVTGATRPVGEHRLTFTDKDKHLADLAPGDYTLIVEASREVGGREMVEIPFTWPADKAQTHKAEGKEELGQVTLTVKP